jgi:hypothetical protein
MTVHSRFNTICTSYGRTVEVGRLSLTQGSGDERVYLDIPRQNPEFDNLWLALSPEEACDLADLLVWHAQVAKSRAVGAGGGNVRSD